MSPPNRVKLSEECVRLLSAERGRSAINFGYCTVLFAQMNFLRNNGLSEPIERFSAIGGDLKNGSGQIAEASQGQTSSIRSTLNIGHDY